MITIRIRKEEQEKKMCCHTKLIHCMRVHVYSMCFLTTQV